MRNLREKYRPPHFEPIGRPSDAQRITRRVLLGAQWVPSERLKGWLSELDQNVPMKPLVQLRFTTCLIFKWYGKLKIQCTKWHENVGTWNLDLVCRSLSFFCGSDEILVLMLVMVCHFYVIFWTWSMLKYDRDRFPFLKPEHVMCVPFMNIHEYHINQQMANDSTNFYGFSFHHPKCMR